jgi:hypothetical protein
MKRLAIFAVLLSVAWGLLAGLPARSLSLVFAFSTLLIVGGTLFWIGVIRRELFDPRIYVLYGIFHWLLVGQIAGLLGVILDVPLVYLDLGFSDTTHLEVSLSVLTGVIAFLVG